MPPNTMQSSRLALLLVTLIVAVLHIAVAQNVTNVQQLPVAARQQWVHTLSQRGCRYANQMRTSRGVRPLYFSGVLTRLGSRHSSWMASTYIFRHQNLGGLGGYVGSHWLPVSAENIAMSSPRSSDAAWDAHQQWVQSPPHFHNMMSPSHTHCGVGIAFDHSGRWWGTQLFGRNYNFGSEGGSAAVAPAPAAAPAAAPASAPARAPAPAPGRSGLNADVEFEDVNPGNSRDFTPNSRQI
ncbi:unnamed protein product [Agarophyton chilense]